MADALPQPAVPDPDDRRSAPRDTGDRRAALRNDEDLRAREDLCYALARTAERHDPDTGRHLLRIRDLVGGIAGALGGFDDREGALLGIDAMLHDVGKLVVPPALLQKPGELTAEERTLVERHTVEGEAILSERPALARAARIARAHHERWDGGGYPDGLAGDAIPLEARITAVADVFDALASARAYKQAFGERDALERVRGLAGTHLDPAIVAALERVLADPRSNES